MLASFEIFKQLTKVNNYSMGENWPKVVTLVSLKDGIAQCTATP
jgi:hypothetical protein